MRLECPLCGAKMVEGQICKYCGTTINQVKTASNKQAKIAFKLKHKEDVCYSTYIPADVNKKKLYWLTFLCGYLGIHSLYIGRKIKGFFSLISFGLEIVIQIIILLNTKLNWGIATILNNCNSVFAFFATVAFLMWLYDISMIMFKRFKVPVVLGKEKYAKENYDKTKINKKEEKNNEQK